MPGSSSTNRALVRRDPILHQLVPSRQNLDRIALQRPGKDWVGDDGSAGIHHIVVHHVHATTKERD